MQTAPVFRRLAGAVMAVAAIAIAAAQPACNDNNYSSPTAAPQPPPPVQPAIIEARYSLLLFPNVGQIELYPLTGVLLLDDRILRTSVLGDPWEIDNYGDPRPERIYVSVEGALSAGDHTLTFRVVDQPRRLNYVLHWRVEVFWNSGGVTLLAGGVNSIQLRVGEAWSTEFVVPVAPPI